MENDAYEDVSSETYVIPRPYYENVSDGPKRPPEYVNVNQGNSSGPSPPPYGRDTAYEDIYVDVGEVRRAPSSPRKKTFSVAALKEKKKVIAIAVGVVCAVVVIVAISVGIAVSVELAASRIEGELDWYNTLIYNGPIASMSTRVRSVSLLTYRC